MHGAVGDASEYLWLESAIAGEAYSGTAAALYLFRLYRLPTAYAICDFPDRGCTQAKYNPG